MATTAETLNFLETALLAERARLVRLCAKLAGDSSAAEDLAQETLYEAWRNHYKLHDPAGVQPWLSAIARNVCLRWRSGRDQVTPPSRQPNPDEWANDDCDLEWELERQDLVDLLERALALLPPETRAILVSRYVDELPQAEIAEMFRLSEGAVKMRLRRGKLALRRALATDLAAEVNAYGLLNPTSDGWQETRIWCPNCGRRHLEGRFAQTDAPQDFVLKCPDCHPDPGFSHCHVRRSHEILGAIHTFKPALNRIAAWVSESYREIVETGFLSCPYCARRNLLRPYLPEALPSGVRGQRGMHVQCDVCGVVLWENTVPGLLLTVPAVAQFWRDHPRLQTLPEREVESSGMPAIVTSFASLSDSAGLDVVSSTNSFHLLEVHRVSLTN